MNTAAEKMATGKNGNRKKTSVKTATKFGSSDTDHNGSDRDDKRRSTILLNFCLFALFCCD